MKHIKKSWCIYQNQKWIGTIDAETKDEAIKQAKQEFPKVLNLFAREYNPILWDIEDRIIKLGLLRKFVAEQINMSLPTFTKTLSGYRPIQESEIKELRNILNF